MRRMVVLAGAVLAVVFVVEGAFGAPGRVQARPAAGSYTGTTSEGGSVAFTVAAGDKRLTGFTTVDGYNRVCKFSGGVGGIPNFPVKIAAITISSSGLFTATTKAKVGPFSATLKVSGKFTTTGVTGTVDNPGATCGKAAANPTAHLYRETFTAKHT